MRRSLALLALLVGACVRPLEEAPLPLDPVSATYARSVEAAVHDARQAQGLRRAVWSDALARSAQRHSLDLARRGALEHVTADGRDPSARAEAVGVDCLASVGPDRLRRGVLENLAVVTPTRVSQTSPTGERMTVYRATAQEVTRQVIDGWLDSPGHRRVLLAPSVRLQGIGVAVDADHRVLVTQLLC